MISTRARGTWLAPHVRWADVDGVVYVLDLLAGTYLALDPSWSDTWMALTGEATETPAGDGTRETLVAAAETRGWLNSEIVPPRRSTWAIDTGDVWLRSLSARLPVVGAWCCLAGASLRLQRRGFWSSYAALSQYPEREPGAEAPVSLAAASAAFLTAERAFVSRRGVDDCLPRSFALFAFLRVGCGLPVQHVIGIHRYPFTAHAWVEHDGIPVLDRGRRTAEFTPIARI